MEANIVLARKLNVAAWIITILVLGLVASMREISLDLPFSTTFLPALYSELNAFSAVVLVAAFYFIRIGRVDLHKRAVTLALSLSAIFLLLYVTYHVTNPATIFGDYNQDGVLSSAEAQQIGSWRILYLLLLISHIVLATISFPFILFTYIRGFTAQYKRHRKMAKWVFPLWLYVAITGPICYLMLRPFYG